MFFTQQDSLDQTLVSIKKELQRAAHDGKHPFRYVVLSTGGTNPRARYVVLRRLLENDIIEVYTDFRSDKIKEIQENTKVSLLFYHPKKKLQVITGGQVSIHNQDEVADSVRSKLDPTNLGDYTTQLAPGTRIDSPEEGWEKLESLAKENFTVLRIVPDSLEVLQLDRSGHLRCIFEKENDWRGQWLVP